MKVEISAVVTVFCTEASLMPSLVMKQVMSLEEQEEVLCVWHGPQIPVLEAQRVLSTSMSMAR